MSQRFAKRALGWFGAIALALAAPLAAQQPTAARAAFDATRLTRIDAYLQQAVDSQRIAGAVALVMRDGVVVFRTVTGGWSSRTIVEDTDLGLTLLERGWREREAPEGGRVAVPGGDDGTAAGGGQAVPAVATRQIQHAHSWPDQVIVPRKPRTGQGKSPLGSHGHS